MQTQIPEKLTADEDIMIMSLSPHPLTLTTNQVGQTGGVEYNFSRYGEIKPIINLHVSAIIEAHRRFAEVPYFYIMDERVVQRHGLSETYSKILSKEQIDQILNCESREVVQLYKSAPVTQKEIINKILIQKLINGDEIDLNVISALSLKLLTPDPSYISIGSGTLGSTGRVAAYKFRVVQN